MYDGVDHKRMDVRISLRYVVGEMEVGVFVERVYQRYCMLDFMFLLVNRAVGAVLVGVVRFVIEFVEGVDVCCGFEGD